MNRDTIFKQQRAISTVVFASVAGLMSKDVAAAGEDYKIDDAPNCLKSIRVAVPFWLPKSENEIGDLGFVLKFN